VESLDSLLGPEERHGTFHDAVISSVHVDYAGSRLAALMQLCVGDPDADEQSRERRRGGELVVEGLTLWALEPPEGADSRAGDGLWLTTEGPLSQAPTAAGQALARSLGSNDVGWFFYFNNLNAFGYLAGRRVSFRWL
jgi:hypothetical protein